MSNDKREEREYRKLREFIAKAAREVAKWPRWMVGKPDPKGAKP